MLKVPTLTVHEMTETSFCLCGSEKPYGKCCAALTNRKQATVVRSQLQPGTGTPKYFIICTIRKEIYKDPDGKVPIFQSRAQALRTRELLGGEYIGVVGVLEEKFARLAQIFPDHYLVPDSSVVA